MFKALVGSLATALIVAGLSAVTPAAAARQQAVAAYWTPARTKAARPDSELPSMKAAALAMNTRHRSGSGQRVSCTPSRHSSTTTRTSATTSARPG